MSIATAISMKLGCDRSNNLLEIDQIQLTGEYSGWYYKETLHNYLNLHPYTIRVKDSNGPFVIPATSINGEKYVKSTPNNTTVDNLLSLPRR